MASMRDIKRRKGSIQSTQQITKAMKLVSTVKLQRTKQRALNSKAYFSYMYNTVQSILSKAGTINHSYVTGNDSTNKAVIVISGNRGLAGYVLADDYSYMIEAPDYVDAMRLSAVLLNQYRKGEIGEIYLAFTAFKNTVSHEPTLLKLLPVDQSDVTIETDDKVDVPMNFEPAEEEALELIIPKYVASIIHGAMIESVASENGARMQAMDSATSNAEEMIDKLTLQYNRARQGSITQELTEIIAGAQAIS